MRYLVEILALASIAAAWNTQDQTVLGDLDEPVNIGSHSENWKFDPLKHLPGISPYFDAIGFGLDHTPPLGCNVTAATYLVRHASIYANDDEYEEYIKPFLYKLEKHRGGWSGPLEFLNQWHSPILEDQLEEVTPAGHRDATRVGKHLLSHYPHLIPATKAVLADKKNRTLHTAQSFVKAFPQAGDINVIQILKDKNGSMDSLIPHKSCPKFSKSPGQKQMNKFVENFMPSTADRLNPYTPAKLNSSDIMALHSLCGYESAILGGRSQICGVFTDTEWSAYEYAWDLKYAYMVGPLNKLSPYLGFPWLQAQSELFAQLHHADFAEDAQEDLPADSDAASGWPPGQRFFLSFTHREVPPFVATALGIFNSSSLDVEQFPTDHINWVRSWKMSDLIPFLGHVGMEKLHCERPGMKEKHYVRVIANSAPRPMPICQSGPGASCPFPKFQKIMARGYKKYGDFHGVCGKSPK